MPNIKSAKKRVLVAQKKNIENRALRSRMNNAIKKFNNAIETNNIDEAEKLLPETMSVIDSTVSKGVIHKNNAANKKSALAKKLSDVKSGKVEIKIKKDNKTIAAEHAPHRQRDRLCANKTQEKRQSAKQQNWKRKRLNLRKKTQRARNPKRKQPQINPRKRQKRKSLPQKRKKPKKQ